MASLPPGPQQLNFPPTDANNHHQHHHHYHDQGAGAGAGAGAAAAAMKLAVQSRRSDMDSDKVTLKALMIFFLDILFFPI